MSVQLCVLGSGSGGNSTVVRAPQGTFLIDAGFGPRTTATRMHRTGVDVGSISGILLTHLDRDHFNFNWLQTILKFEIPVFCAAGKRRELVNLAEVGEAEAALRKKRLLRKEFAELVCAFEDGGAFEPVRGVGVEALPLMHDESGSHGFLLTCESYRIGFATDLGRVPQVLIERFCGVDILLMEANYDPEMEKNSERPWYLKQRIMGGRGHLSNQQALAAVQAILDRTISTCGPDRLPRHIVLLHRSRECNCPKLLRELFETDARIAQVLTLTEQEEPTVMLCARAPRARASEQLTLAWN